jgi:hypothetical protein
MQRLRDKSSRSRPSYGGCVMPSNDTQYFLERAITEREMAKAAKHPKAVTAHEELAWRYDSLLREMTRLHLVSASRISEAA